MVNPISNRRSPSHHPTGERPGRTILKQAQLFKAVKLPHSSPLFIITNLLTIDYHYDCELYELFIINYLTILYELFINYHWPSAVHVGKTIIIPSRHHHCWRCQKSGHPKPMTLGVSDIVLPSGNFAT